MVFTTRRRNRPQTDVPLRWLELDAADLAGRESVLGDVLDRRLDGITVSGVFTADEAAQAVARLGDPWEGTTPAMFGCMLGQPLAEVVNTPGGRNGYLDEVDTWRSRYRDAFGFDPDRRVADVIGPMAGGRTVGPPDEGGRRYNFGNLRRFEPGSGGLPAHVGNEFQMHDDESLAHLRSTTRTSDHISWFVIVQAPEAGGALSVYDRQIDEHSPVDRQWTADGRDDTEFDGIAARRVAPPAGSLVLFGGGWRWHRVDAIGGTVPRITYGGFAGPSLDGRAVNFWF